MSFFRYVGPNSPLPPAPKGDYGALSSYKNPAATIHLTGSSPRTALIDGMFTYHPPASYRAQGQPSPPIFTDAGHVGAEGQQEVISIADLGQYLLPVFLCIESIIEADQNGLPSFQAVDGLSFSDSFVIQASGVYAATESFVFSDNAALPGTFLVESSLWSDHGQVLSVSGGSYSYTEAFFVSDQSAVLLPIFSNTDSVTDAGVLLKLSNTDALSLTDTAQQLKP